MKILFVSSGNIPKRKSILVKNPLIQGESLKAMGCEVDFFLIVGKGFIGYVKNIPRLRSCLKKGGYDLIHAHYSLTGILTSLATSTPLVVSLMGSDLHICFFVTFVTKVFCKNKWRKVIVKTEQMKEILNYCHVQVIPNGVDMDFFKPVPKKVALRKIRQNDTKKIILFVSDINRKEKNFTLAQKAVNIMGMDDVILLNVSNVAHNQIIWYLNACEVLLLTSLREGSVNIVKEAMACNVKVVSTRVGDVENNINNVPGYYLTSFEPENVAQNIIDALNYAGPVEGRQRLFELGLDSRTINNRLIELYKDAIQ